MQEEWVHSARSQGPVEFPSGAVNWTVKVHRQVISRNLSGAGLGQIDGMRKYFDYIVSRLM
jgi:hypothetical protein